MNSVTMIADVIALVIGTLLGAMLLRAGIWIYNRIAGGADSPRGLPEPSFGRAWGIVAVATLVSIVVGTPIGPGTNRAAGTSFLVGVLIEAGVLSYLLPTKYGRALLATLCQLVIFVPLVAVISIVWILIGSFGTR
jgi:hypothetical protein